MAKKKPEAEAENEEGAGGKKKLIVIIVAAVVLIGVGVGGALMFMGGGDEAADSAQAESEAPPEPEKGDPTYIELKPFTVNLDPEDPVGFLQVSLNILTYYPAVAEQVEKHKPLIRNNLTLLFGQQKSADLRSPEGKTELQNKAKETIQQVIDKYGEGGEIDNVFFTTFVMQ